MEKKIKDIYRSVYKQVNKDFSSYKFRYEEHMEKKPKTSQLFWEKNTTNAETQSGAKIEYFDGHKPTYDKILSIEAKIEAYTNVYSLVQFSEFELYVKLQKHEAESELQQIAEQEGLN